MWGNNNRKLRISRRLDLAEVSSQASPRGHLNKLYIWATMGILAALSIPVASMATASNGPAHSVQPKLPQSSETTTFSNSAASDTESLEPAPAAPSSQSGQTTSGSATNSSDSSVSVMVNGQNIPVPANGSVNQTLTSPSGDTNVHISVSNTSTGRTSPSRTNTNLHLNTLNSVDNVTEEDAQ